ncbi:hypothetical protein R6Q59_012638 [Mikania micrantha]
MKMYDATQSENLEKLSVKNEAQMKGHFKRLSENGKKRLVEYREAYHQRKSGMSQKDIENKPHKPYEQDKKSKFTRCLLFNEESRAMRLTRDGEIKLVKQRLELEK